MRMVRRMLVVTMALGVAGSLAGVGTYAALLQHGDEPGEQLRGRHRLRLGRRRGKRGAERLRDPASDPASSGCIRVTYAGSLDASARLYASSSGALAPYVNLTITEGTSSSPFDSCATFTGSSILYSGPLSGMPATWASGLADADGTWTTGEEHAYRFDVTIQDTPLAQGRSASATFTWEARNR